LDPVFAVSRPASRLHADPGDGKKKIGEIHGKIMGKIMGKYRNIMGKSDSSDHEMADFHGKIPLFWQFCFSTEG